jgi:hypothetical protein
MTVASHGALKKPGKNGSNRDDLPPLTKKDRAKKPGL